MVEDKEGIHVYLFFVRDELQQTYVGHNTACMMLSVYVQLLQAGRTEQTVRQMHAKQLCVETWAVADSHCHELR